MLGVIHTCQRSIDIAWKTDQIVKLSKRKYGYKLEIVCYIRKSYT